MYADKLFPFLKDGDFIRSKIEVVDINNIYCPLEADLPIVSVGSGSKKIFKLTRVMPCNVLVVNDSDDVAYNIKQGIYGNTLKAYVSEIDYTSMASRVEVDTVDDVLSATVNFDGAYQKEEVVTDSLINMSCNGTEVDTGSLDIKIPYKSGINFIEWMENYNKSVNESADFLDSLIADKKSGKDIKGKILGESKDSIYDWLDSYFALPEEADMKGGGREVVPLLIGPTAVFKSATVKELCAKYNYRMVDFRVAFTSRLDYSGLYQMGEIDGSKFSYSCPMEELVTCSDGFRAFCRKALDKVKKILSDGYMEDNKVSDGENQDSNHVQLTSEQIEKLNKLVQSYEYYLRTPVLFMDEITRCRDEGVNGVLVQLLNQKRFNDMTMNGCKFVAATNLNISRDRDHLEYSDELQDMYDVQVEIDVAYANRFMPLLVQPKDVEGRWFEWAEGTKEKNGKTVTSIHQIVLDFLKGEGSDLVYNDQPVIDAIKEGLSDNEKRAQTFPNYRTWEMLSDYIYSIDEDYEVRLKDDADAKREYRSHIIEGLISKWAGKRFIKYIEDHDYYEYDSVHGQVADDVGDFLSSTLSAGVPALLIGPSSLGKTSRVHAYMKDVERRTGLKPILINVNLASCDTTDLMGYPIKKSLVEYSAGSDLEKLGLGSVQKDLQSIMSGVQSNLDYGMTDYVTLRAPDMRMKERFKRALDEGREVILFFDEANRVKNPTIMSAMFECFTEDTEVRLLDGRNLTMGELYNEADEGNLDLWTYSVDSDGKVVPGHISCVIKKKSTSKIIKITMEDGTTVKCTEDHKFMLRDGSYVMAKDLTEDMDIMEIFSRVSDKSNGDTISGYEIVSTNKNSEEEYTHRIVAFNSGSWFDGCGKVIHHIDFNKRNNLPKNLNCDMTYLEHVTYHGNHLKYLKDNTDFEEKRREGFYKMVNDKGKSYERWVSNLSKPRDKEVCNRISETRKRKCKESDEYRKSVASAFIRYNEKVASGEIIRDYSSVIQYHKDHPEHAQRFKQAGIQYWMDEGHRQEQSERMKKYFSDPENRKKASEHGRIQASINNRNPRCTALQQLGKVKLVVKACINIFGNISNMTEDIYEVGRSTFSYKNLPKYDTALARLDSLDLGFKDLILEIVGGND